MRRTPERSGLVRVVVVSGTDSGVGKTIVVAGLASLAVERGESVAVVKPVQTGPGPGDLEHVRRLTGVEDLHELVRFDDAIAPATAARRAGQTAVAPGSIAAAIDRLHDRDLVLVEGCGGLLERLHDRGGTIADVAAMLGAPVLVVVRPDRGALNATALTCEALRARRVPCAGVVIGSRPAVIGPIERCALEELSSYAHAPLVGAMPAGAGHLDRDAFRCMARAAIIEPARSNSTATDRSVGRSA